MAMPTKRTQERTDAAVAVIRAGHSQRAAASHIGVSRATWHLWMQTETFAEQIRAAEDEREGRLLTQIRAAVPKDWKAAAWLLERFHPEVYGQRNNVQMTVDVKEIAKRVAAESGLEDVDALVAEAERIATGG